MRHAFPYNDPIAEVNAVCPEGAPVVRPPSLVALGTPWVFTWKSRSWVAIVQVRSDAPAVATAGSLIGTHC